MPPNRTQYENFATLTETECTLQVDFSENCKCHFLQEISSVYYSKNQVKVRPTVINYKRVNLKHKSLAVLSDEMAQCCIIGWSKSVQIPTILNLMSIVQGHVRPICDMAVFRHGAG